MGVARVNGLDVAYDRAGSGAPLVLVHAGAADARMWQPQLRELADEFDVVAWDEPGAGRSSDLPAGWTLADHADCLGALVDVLGLAPAHVLGLSWGGTVVLELYRRRPDVVATLVLADTYAGWRGSLPDAEVRARVTATRAMLEAPEAMDPIGGGMFAGEPPAEAVRLLHAAAADVRPASIQVLVALMAAADLRDVLPGIAVPTLLLWGEEDVRSPLSVGHELAAAIPAATLVVLPGAGHLSNLEAPEAFDEAVRRFCRAHQSGAGAAG